MMSPGLDENPEYRLETIPMKQRVQVFLDGELVAESKNAIKLFEGNLDPVIYIPYADIHAVSFLKFEEYTCPFKGQALLLTIRHHKRKFENAAWTYYRPFEEVKELKNHIAFSPHKVQEIRVTG